MSTAIPVAPVRGGILSRIMPTEQAIQRIFVWAGVPLLICSIVFPLHLQDRLPYNFLPSLPISFFLILTAIAIRGVAVLRRTPFDLILFSLVGLTILSTIHATLVLNRMFFEIETISILLNMFNMWFIYRAMYAFTIIDAQSASRALLFWMLLVITVCTLIGVLQSVGPFQNDMVNFAYRIGVGEFAIKLGAAEVTGVRTTSVFSGPNIFGFVNLIGCSILIGIAMAFKQRLRELHGVVILMGLGLFSYANLNSQSRLTFVFAAILGIVFLVYLIRVAKWRALLTSAVMFVLMGIGTVILTTGGGYEYMTNIFNTGVKNDVSYQVRVKGLERVAEVANEIPVLGVGQDYYSLMLFGKGDYYSRGNGAGDNGLAMSYFLLGIPGVVHLFFLNYVCFRALKKLKSEDRIFISTIKSATWLVFWLFVVTIPYAVRYQKLETFSYWLLLFGVVFGLLTLQEQRDRRLGAMGLTADDMKA
jgi:hypothetical protein